MDKKLKKQVIKTEDVIKTMSKSAGGGSGSSSKFSIPASGILSIEESTYIKPKVEDKFLYDAF